MAALYILYKLLLTVGFCFFHSSAPLKRASIELESITKKMHADADNMYADADTCGEKMHADAEKMHADAEKMRVKIYADADKMHAGADACGPEYVRVVDSLRTRLALF